MRAVRKSYQRIPDSLRSTGCHQSLVNVCNGGTPDKDSISSDFYRSGDVINKLSRIYLSKCAYCETVDPDFEVEHYRPKKQVAVVDRNGQGHFGYYWLSYEWSNLIPACHDCNKTGVKGNRFPIRGNRVNSPSLNNGVIDQNANHFLSAQLKDEIPLLIHPEEPSFDPNSYFKFNNKGEMVARPRPGTLNYERANTTIEIVALNREKLKIIQRKKAIQDIAYQLKGLLLEFVHSFERDQDRAYNRLKKHYFNILNQIKKKTSPSNEYSFFWAYLLNHMDVVFQVAMKPKYRKVFIVLTNEFKHL